MGPGQGQALEPGAPLTVGENGGRVAVEVQHVEEHDGGRVVPGRSAQGGIVPLADRRRAGLRLPIGVQRHQLPVQHHLA